MLPDWDTALAALGRRLGPKGVAHSVRVAETAAQIASAYGVDSEAARIAGLLHDWCKDVAGEELLQAAETRGLPVTDVDAAVPYLLHSAVGAEEVREAFPGIDESVVQAIAAHTYGSECMSPVDMVVYVADTIEPGRSHTSARELREAIGKVPLTELFTRTYAESLRHLIDTRRRIHPNTTAMWNRLVGGECL
ncbi:MAG: bis(5'-nucleosyl)-tetraphosphatase (symmetrical) YqeK [Actinomycetia bacterium]|nr:bis(5'-nucleosyl)-tetraphosphatase (symmetrical) YqeK [Actinomycetes bacterium]